jgi:hypothetical protein
MKSEKNFILLCTPKEKYKTFFVLWCNNMDGTGMKKQENMYISLQLDKDITSGELVLNIQFDRNAPNFFTNKNTISWCPTNEELDFINEAFGLITKKKHPQQDHNEEPDFTSADSGEPIREADETEILDRVFEKKRPSGK